MSELDLAAIADQKLECLNFNKFTAIVEVGLDLSQLESQTESDWVEFAIAYSKIQCEIFAKVKAMLPWSLRSAFFADLARLQQFLETDQVLFLTRLEALAGWGEFSLVAKFEPELDNPDSIKQSEVKGRAYFALRKQEFELKQQISLEATKIIELVQSDPDKVVLGKLREKEQMRSSVLVKTAELEQVRERLNNWQQSHLGWRIELGEPLPPYSFVNAKAEEC